MSVTTINQSNVATIVRLMDNEIVDLKSSNDVLLVEVDKLNKVKVAAEAEINRLDQKVMEQAREIKQYENDKKIELGSLEDEYRKFNDYIRNIKGIKNHADISYAGTFRVAMNYIVKLETEVAIAEEAKKDLMKRIKVLEQKLIEEGHPTLEEAC